MIGRVGGKEPFEEGRTDLEELAGVCVSTKAVERAAEAIGEDIEASEKPDRELRTDYFTREILTRGKVMYEG